jgi:hypothetical protein
MLSQEQKNRLTPDELVIAEKWEAERELRDLIYAEIQAACDAKDNDAMLSATRKLVDSAPSQCEHDRHVMVGCAACDELERKLYPECFDNCIDCGELVNKEELENGRCMDCED